MPPPSIAHNGHSTIASMYSSSSSSRGHPTVAHRPVGDLPATCYTSHQTSTSYDDLVTQTNHHQPRSFTDPPNVLTYGSYAHAGQQAQHPPEDNYGDDAARRKKVCIAIGWVCSDEHLTLSATQIRKMHAAEQYVCVTCGRTDSPEWRKVCRLQLSSSVVNFGLYLLRAHKGQKPFATPVACDGQNKYALNRMKNHPALDLVPEFCSVPFGTSRPSAHHLPRPTFLLADVQR
jgi:hypothetical protein